MQCVRPIVASVLASSLLLSAQSVAQEAAPSEGGVTNVSEETLERYADAYVDVQKIVGDYRDDLANSEQADVEELRVEYRETLKTAVEDAGLSVARYNEIYRATKNDPALRDRAIDKISDARHNGTE